MLDHGVAGRGGSSVPRGGQWAEGCFWVCLGHSRADLCCSRDWHYKEPGGGMGLPGRDGLQSC